MFSLSRGRLLLVLSTILKTVTKAPHTVQLRSPQLKFIEIDEDGKDLIGPYSQPTLTPLHIKWLLLSYAAGWAERKLD